MKGWIKKTLS